MRNWKLWAKAAAVRAVKTMAQTAVATIGVAADARCELDRRGQCGSAGWGVVCFDIRGRAARSR